MTPFLKQVARHYCASGSDLERMCFVFPNRRALVFFRKYLSEEVRDRPVVAPSMMSMGDFVFRASGTPRCDKLRLLLRLYDCYSPLYKGRTGRDAEPLDDFVYWGDVLLNDFNDVDKYLADPKGIFTNVAEFKRIQDWQDCLSETQKAALEQFLSHFSGNDAGYKDKFLQVWDILYPLYRDFNARLDAEGLSYEGMAYRRLAEAVSGNGPGVMAVSDLLGGAFPDTDKFVFVGLNALSGCEKVLLGKMRDAHIAEFCWDFSSPMIRHPQNKSSLFLARNVEEFPQAFRIDADGLGTPQFNVVSVPSSVGQAKLLPRVLRECGDSSIRTAVVLPDENLLLPVLNCIPEEVRDINVTMGYPLSGSAIFSLMSEISALQMHLRLKDGEYYFYHQQLWAILSNSVLRTAVRDDAAALDAMARIRKEARYYVAAREFAGSPLLETIFRPVVTDTASRDPEQISAISRYQMEVVTAIAVRIKGDPEMAVELDFAMDYYQAVKRFSSEPLPLLPATYLRAFGQLTGLASDSVPFKGEPLRGLQIMGPLEMRALDFDNVIVLSCNEGTFPRRSVSSSFIPPELRKGFGLPTYEYQDAVWAYYFYRMVQRATNVWLLFDSRTEMSRSGEESRYIKQLEMHFGVRTRRFIFDSPVQGNGEPPVPEKTPDVIGRIREKVLSASALQTYLSCPLKFYYGSIEQLSPEEEVSEALDAGMIGSILHETMHELYEGRGKIDAAYLDSLLKDSRPVVEKVGRKIIDRLNAFEVAGRNLIFKDMIVSYVLQILRRDRELLDDYGTDSFTVLKMEERTLLDFGGFRFKGFIDRLDSFVPGEVRVVDYKTGKVLDLDINIDDSNAAQVVDKLFGKVEKERPKIALQLFLYDRMAEKLVPGKTLFNSIYQTASLFAGKPVAVPLSPHFAELMEARLHALLEEMTDPAVPLRRAADRDACKYCDFKAICGR